MKIVVVSGSLPHPTPSMEGMISVVIAMVMDFHVILEVKGGLRKSIFPGIDLIWVVLQISWVRIAWLVLVYYMV